MNFVVGALLIGRLARDPNLYQQLSTNSSVTEDAFPSIQRYQVESDIFWATQVLHPILASLTHSLLSFLASLGK
jgi:hypothetical protein